MKVVLVGAGRTGSRIAVALAERSADLTIVDRDCVEERDLEGSPAFTAADVGKMKARALAAKVLHCKTNASRNSEDAAALCEHFCSQNATELLGRAQIVIDATDNWRARATINEWCWREGVPWVYCGALGTKAMAAAIVPPEKPCWLCWNQNEPAQVMSCSVYGIDERAAEAAAAKAVELALGIGEGKGPTLAGKLFFADAEKGIETKSPLAANENCPVCAKEKYSLLGEQERAELVCGSGQWLFPNAGLEAKFRHYNADGLAAKLGRDARVVQSVVRIARGKTTAIVFPGGRATIRAPSEAMARKLNDEIVQRLST